MVDQREVNAEVNREIVPYLKASGIEAEVKTIYPADYIVGDGAAVERKTYPDFVASIPDGRLTNEVEMLCLTYDVPYLILEGKTWEWYSGFAKKAAKFKFLSLFDKQESQYNWMTAFVNVRNVLDTWGEHPDVREDWLNKRDDILNITEDLLHLTYNPLRVIPSRDLEDTKEWLAFLCEFHQIEKKHGPPRIRESRKTLTLDEQRQYLLEGFPAVGATKAIEILKKFSPIAFVKALEQSTVELTKGGNPKGISGPLKGVIGVKTLQEIQKVMGV